MSVFTDEGIRYRPYPNPTGDPRLPVMIWYMQAAVVGDASGGSARVSFLMNRNPAGRSGMSWSIEESWPSVNGAAADVLWIVNTLNFDVLGPGLTNPIQKTFTQTCVFAGAVGNPTASVSPGEAHPRLFLGTQGASALSPSIDGKAVNTNGDTFGWYASGYVWSPAALKDGALKPIDSLLS